MKTHIIYRNYLKPDGSQMSIGGIQTYIRNLTGIFRKCGYQVIIHQIATQDFEMQRDGVIVYGYRVTSKAPKQPMDLFKKCKGKINKEKDILVFGCETFAVKAAGYKTIGIQHGITWDQPWLKSSNKFVLDTYYYHKAVKGMRVIKRVEQIGTLVCVDDNFVNWYRAVTAHPRINYKVVPNFTRIVPPCAEKQCTDKIEIIFARRFAIYRGTRLFAEAVTKVLEKYENVYITFAGDGEEKDWLVKKFSGNPCVEFITYKSEESLDIHLKKHIAVVPTIGSEGTSLSLLEAMSASCAVICTNVGGMSNMILDGFNGLKINPDINELYDALCRLIDDRAYRRQIAINGYDSTRAAFSYEKWEEKWKNIISEFENA